MYPVLIARFNKADFPRIISVPWRIAVILFVNFDKAVRFVYSGNNGYVAGTMIRACIYQQVARLR
jgi:hypothetical protein